MPIRLRERFEVKFELFDSRVGRRNHLLIGGQGEKTVIFSHGFGCDQSMWRHVVPAIARRYRVALYDHVGAGGSDLSAYSESKYSSLKGYAENAVEICEELGVRDCVFVGHSVSAMIGAEIAWWTEHKKHDAARQADEANSKQLDKDREAALAKLTAAERKLLGL